MKKLVVLCSLAAAAAGFWAGRETTVSAAGNHVYEFRRYTAEPGKLEELQARFRNHTDAIFKKHNMKSVGYLGAIWTSLFPKTRSSIFWNSRAATQPRNRGTNSAPIPSGRRCRRNPRPTASW